MTQAREPKARCKANRIRRVNARFDAETARKLDELVRARKRNVTDVLKEAVEALHRKLADERRPSSHEVALKVGFIGCGEGPEDLSTNYKRYLYEGWSEKHGIALPRGDGDKE
ncbi:MAG: ribbon-helix-helix protein, CopG family [Betaproteobacteria bacterium]